MDGLSTDDRCDTNPKLLGSFHVSSSILLLVRWSRILNCLFRSDEQASEEEDSLTPLSPTSRRQPHRISFLGEQLMEMHTLILKHPAPYSTRKAALRSSSSTSNLPPS